MAKLRAKVWLICLLLMGVFAALSAFFILEQVDTERTKKAPPWAAKYKDVPVRGMVTMIDLGATSCLPCKLMAPIMKKLEKAYKGKAGIIFIDVWKHRDQSKRFGIRTIPTQIFFNREGKEVYRHEGFMSEAAIVRQLKKMGVE
jgi:thioredoxin 1